VLWLLAVLNLGALAQTPASPVPEVPASAPAATYASKSVGTMRLIPAGTFTMGCKPGRDDVAGGCFDWESPPHTVTLTKPYYMMEHEVTQGEWSAVMGGNPSRFSSCGPTCPVENVSWNDAQAFIAKVSARDGVTYRLPTEAEWEYAARGGAGYAYAGSNDLGSVGWYGAYDVGNSRWTTHPACGKARNGYGLCDMTGNISEWTADWDGDYASTAQTDPRGRASGSGRVYRGGSWSIGAQGTRVAQRYGSYPDHRDDYLGFRLVMSVP
jgi:formylglycine-generating enzyme required for sulfatase activity